MDYSTRCFPVLHHLLEFTQTHDHAVSDTNQPSHPLSPYSPPALSLSQNQGLCHWFSSSHQVAKVLEFQCQHQPFQWIFRVFCFRNDWFDLLAVQGTLNKPFAHSDCAVDWPGQTAISWLTDAPTLASELRLFPLHPQGGRRGGWAREEEETVTGDREEGTLTLSAWGDLIF